MSNDIVLPQRQQLELQMTEGQKMNATTTNNNVTTIYSCEKFMSGAVSEVQILTSSIRPYSSGKSFQATTVRGRHVSVDTNFGSFFSKKEDAISQGKKLLNGKINELQKSLKKAQSAFSAYNAK